MKWITSWFVCDKEERQLMALALKDWLFYAFLLLFSVWGLGAQAVLPWFTLAPALLAVLCVSFALLCAVDARHQILPDYLTLLLMALGLAFTPFSFTFWQSALGLLVALGLLGGIAWVFYKSRGVHGLGIGDIKLFMALGALGGVPVLVPTMLGAAVAALLFTSIRSFWGHAKGQAFAFGPFLCLAGWASLWHQHLFWQWLAQGRAAVLALLNVA